MNLDDLSNLDFQNVGGWPLPVKVAAILLVCGVIGYATFQYDIKPQRLLLAKKTAQEQEHSKTFEAKQKKAANLEALKLQMAEIQQSFGDMLRQLPNQTEVAGLLVDISQTGLSAGLEFELFKPGKEIPSEFYAEFPIQISVLGEYHEFGEFVSGVASLPRIVTTHDIKIAKVSAKGVDTLKMDATAKTYRALEEEEIEEEEKSKKKGKRSGRR
jgi:type IV pilus assembly protein PilO